MELLDAVKRCTKHSLKRGEIISWTKVTKMMNEANNDDKTLDYYRYHWRNKTEMIDHGKDRVKLKLSRAYNAGKVTTDPESILKNMLKTVSTVKELCYATGLTDIEVMGHIERLRTNGYEITNARVGDEIAYTTYKIVETTYGEFKNYYEVNKTFKIGLISDTHICSKFWQKSHLDAAYQKMHEMGVKDIFHAGDITDGFYKDRLSETYAFGADEQADEVVVKYPKIDGIITKFITGNHDATHIRNGGANIGKAIARYRNDLIYLGQDYAKIWLTDKVDMDLIHPGDGTSYALSYQLQKRINNMSGGRKPKILVTGHYHKYFVMFYRNVIAISLPSFQAQSNWMRGKGIESDMGYVVIEGMINEHGDIVQFNHQFFPFFTAKEHDY